MKRGVKKGDIRGKYNTSKSPKQYRQVRLEKDLADEIDSEEGKNFTEKIKNYINNR